MRGVAAFLAGVGFVLPSAALAQAADQPFAARDGEIVVTAQKRAESVQKVAASITALSGDALQQRSLTTAEALAGAVPGLQFAEHANSTLFAIRGISLDILTGAGEPSVAMHVDGVYQPRATAPMVDMADVARVEVLRGPQGTLYGRNSTGGTVNFISIDPSNTLSGNVAIGTGSFNRFMVRGAISGPLVEDKVLVRVAASYDGNDGWSINRLTGDRIDGRKRYYAHGSVRLIPSDALTLDLSAHYIRETLSGPVQYVFSQGPFFEFAFPGVPVQVTERDHEVYNDFIPHTNRNMLLLSARANWELSDSFSLKSITGYIKQKYHERFDGDGTSLDYITVGDDTTGPRTLDSRSFSQEFNLSGHVGPVDLVAGLFYFHEKFDPFNPIGFPRGIPGAAPAGTEFYALARDVTNSYAAFAELTYNVSDRLRLVGGLRGSVDKKKYTQSFGFSLPGFPLGTGPGMACINEPYKQTWRSLTPKAGIQFDAADKVMLYGQYQKGNKAGQFNLTVCGNQVDPENVDSYEVGIKSRFLDNRLTVNLSAFHYDYADLQVLRFTQVGGVNTSILDNAATAKVDGFELEMTAVPSQRVGVDLAVAYLNSRYDQYVAGPGMDYSGNQLNRAPKWTVKSGAEYRLPMAGVISGLTLRGEVNLTDRVFFDPSNERRLSQPSVVVINGFATLTSDALGMNLRLFGRNLTNQNIRSSIFYSATQNVVQGFWGAPRTWGLELSKTF